MAKKDKRPPSEEEQAAEQVKTASMAEALADYDTYVQSHAESLWTNDELDFDLSLEEKLFVRSYIIDRNEVAALTRLGHMATHQILKARAKKMLAKVAVQDAIDYMAKRLMAKLEVTAERVQEAIAAVAFFDPREVAEWDGMGVRILNSRFWNEHQARAVKKIKMGQNGVEMEFYDGLRAREMLAKQIGLQPEDNDAADAARQGADEALRKIFGVFEKTIAEPAKAKAAQQLPAPDTKH